MYCLNNPNYFCYICGECVFNDCRKVISNLVKNNILQCSWTKMTNQGRVCNVCVAYLSIWKSGKRNSFKFGTTIWGEPKNHLHDCYFYSDNKKGINV